MKENFQRVSELKSNSQMLNQSLKEVMTSNFNKSIEQFSEISTQKINEINQLVTGYKKEFREYKEQTEKKTTKWERRNNIRDSLFYISIFAMPVYVIIEICLKFFAK